MEERRRELEKKKEGMKEKWDDLIKELWEVGREFGMVKKVSAGEWKERDKEVRE